MQSLITSMHQAQAMLADKPNEMKRKNCVGTHSKNTAQTQAGAGDTSAAPRHKAAGTLPVAEDNTSQIDLKADHTRQQPC